MQSSVIQNACFEPEKWKFNFASWEEICDFEIETRQFWRHTETGEEMEEHDSQLPANWDHVCPSCKSPAEMVAISVYAESHRCLSCHFVYFFDVS